MPSSALNEAEKGAFCNVYGLSSAATSAEVMRICGPVVAADIIKQFRHTLETAPVLFARLHQSARRPPANRRLRMGTIGSPA